MSRPCPYCSYVDTGDATLDDPFACPQCGRTRSADSATQVLPSSATTVAQRAIGKFQLMETVGAGAYGAVWKAKDVELGRLVAVKLLHASLVSRSADAERFYREARAAAQLRHPGIVVVHEVLEIDGVPAIASEFVEGLTLRDAIAEHLLDFRQSVEVVAQVAEALEYAHSLKVIHRDVKPSNIMIASTAPLHARLLDFGLALREDAEATLTVHGQVLGTPSYMSPEQATGDSHRVDRRSDVYSLGVVLYEMLTGEVPFKGPSMVVLRKVIGDEPPGPRELQPSLPRDLETICLKAMRKVRETRYQSAGELAADLRRFLAGDPIAARPVGALEKTWRFCRRNPAVALSTIAMCAILLISSIVSLSFALRAIEARRDVELTLVDSYVAHGVLAADRGRPAESLVWFAAAHGRAQAEPQVQRDNEARFWSYARSTPHPQHALLVQPNAKAMVVHPSGHFGLLSEGGKWSLLDFRAERVAEIPDGMQEYLKADWNSTGDLLALGGPAGAAIYDFPSVQNARQLPGLTLVTAVQFDPTGRYLAVADHELKIWDREEGKYTRQPYPLRTRAVELAFSENGQYLAAVCEHDYCRVWSLARPEELELVYSPVKEPGPAYQLANSSYKPLQFVSDDRLLTVCPDGQTLQLIDTTTWLPARTISYSPQQSLPMDWFCISPDRRRIAVGYAAQVLVVDVDSGARVGEPLVHANTALPGSFAADSQTLLTACGDRTCRFWSLPSGKPAGEPVFHQDGVSLAQFLPQSGSFVTIQSDGLTRCWRDEDRSRELPVGGRDCYLAMSPNGKVCVGAGVNLTAQLTEPQLHHLREFSSITSVPLNIEKAQLTNAAFSADSEQVVLLTTAPPGATSDESPHSKPAAGGFVHLFDVATGRPLKSCLATSSTPTGAAFSRDRRYLAVVCAEGETLVVDVAEWRIKHQFTGEININRSFGLRDFVRFFPQGSKFIAWGIGSKARVWDAESGKLEYEIDGKEMWYADVQFSYSGQLFAAASYNKSATVYDAATGRPLSSPLVHPDWVFTLRFSPDDQYLLTACRDGKARLMDWRTGVLKCSTLNHEDEVFDVGFARGGELMLTASRDGSARIWSTRDGKPLSPRLQTTGYCYRVKATPDDALLVVASQAATLTVYSLPRLLEPQAALGRTMMQTAEILAGTRLDAHGGMENLTTREWLDRWQAK